MQVQADRTIEAIDSALAKDKDMLDKAMFDGIMHARAQLEAVALQTLMPFSASITTPSGQSSSCGNIINCGILFFTPILGILQHYDQC
jgi:hypothetical protein